ncbi:O-antigen ligase family protein [Bradyrhizobium mercantei]|uniref:O-antigen ligase family protein n=1 Tax=Bradyrhizobium mercantei TaxID=1904807 RepID=UPI0009FACA94|nr:O-antigen ligase family protein [Bradyrhizobium mercantei]
MMDSKAWRISLDVYPMLIAVAIPWSTTAVLVFWVLWLAAILPKLDQSFTDILWHPVSVSAVTLVVVAAAGVLWSAGPWGQRIVAIGPTVKLLFLPLLLFHFRRSERAHWVFIGFAASCTVLLAYSYVIFAHPTWRVISAHGFDTTGVPVRNAIDQNQEFALCAFGIAAVAIDKLRRHQWLTAIALGGLVALFLANIVFIALARTSLAYGLVLAVMFVVKFFSRRTATAALSVMAILICAVWATSANLRDRVEHVALEYKEYRDTNRPTSAGQRLQYWSSSVEWIREAPLIGHGTGSTKRLFNEAAAGKEGAWGEEIGNPHNQVLYIAIEWGALGIVVVLWMWFCHFRFFRGEGLVAWIGTVVVVQNVLSSMLNSHLFDFTEGWIYVLGVGIAAGSVLQMASKPEQTAIENCHRGAERIKAN